MFAVITDWRMEEQCKNVLRWHHLPRETDREEDLLRRPEQQQQQSDDRICPSLTSDDGGLSSSDSAFLLVKQSFHFLSFPFYHCRQQLDSQRVEIDFHRFTL